MQSSRLSRCWAVVIAVAGLYLAAGRAAGRGHRAHTHHRRESAESQRPRCAARRHHRARRYRCGPGPAGGHHGRVAGRLGSRRRSLGPEARKQRPIVMDDRRRHRHRDGRRSGHADGLARRGIPPRENPLRRRAGGTAAGRRGGTGRSPSTPVAVVRLEAEAAPVSAAACRGGRGAYERSAG